MFEQPTRRAVSGRQMNTKRTQRPQTDHSAPLGEATAAARIEFVDLNCRPTHPWEHQRKGLFSFKLFVLLKFRSFTEYQRKRASFGVYRALFNWLAFTPVETLDCLREFGIISFLSSPLVFKYLKDYHALLNHSSCPIESVGRNLRYDSLRRDRAAESYGAR